MTTKAAVLQAIRQKCLDCSCQQPGEVRACPVTTCDLWPYRFGRDPSPSPGRGFAKADAYTGDAHSRALTTHHHKSQGAGPTESSAHAGDFGKDRRGGASPVVERHP
jgi:hypothetical protein